MEASLFPSTDVGHLYDLGSSVVTEMEPGTVQQILDNLSSAEVARLRNHLLSQDIEELGLNADQALGLLQALEERDTRELQPSFPQPVASFPAPRQPIDVSKLVSNINRIFGSPAQHAGFGGVTGAEMMYQPINELSAINERVQMLEMQKARILMNVQKPGHQDYQQTVGDGREWTEPEAKRRMISNEDKSIHEMQVFQGSWGRGGNQTSQSGGGAQKNQPRGRYQNNQSRGGAQMNLSRGGAQMNQSRGGAQMNQSRGGAQMNQSRGGAQMNQSRGGAQMNQSRGGANMNQSRKSKKRKKKGGQQARGGHQTDNINRNQWKGGEHAEAKSHSRENVHSRIGNRNSGSPARTIHGRGRSPEKDGYYMYNRRSGSRDSSNDRGRSYDRWSHDDKPYSQDKESDQGYSRGRWDGSRERNSDDLHDDRHHQREDNSRLDVDDIGRNLHDYRSDQDDDRSYRGESRSYQEDSPRKEEYFRSDLNDFQHVDNLDDKGDRRGHKRKRSVDFNEGSLYSGDERDHDQVRRYGSERGDPDERFHENLDWEQRGGSYKADTRRSTSNTRSRGDRGGSRDGSREAHLDFEDREGRSRDRDEMRDDQRNNSRNHRRKSWNEDIREVFIDERPEERWEDRPVNIYEDRQSANDFFLRQGEMLSSDRDTAPRSVDNDTLEMLMDPPDRRFLDFQINRSNPFSATGPFGAPSPLIDQNVHWHPKPFPRSKALPAVGFPRQIPEQLYTSREAPLSARMQGFVTRTITNSSKKKTEKDLKTTKSFETKIATSMAHWLLSRPKEVTVEKPNPDRMKEMNKTQAAVSAVATISTNAAPKAGSDTPLTKSGSQGKEDSKSSKASKSKDVSSIGGSQVMNKEGTGKVVKTLSTSTKPVSTKGPQPKQLIPQFNSITDQSSILEHLDLQGFLYQKVLTLWTCYVCRAALNHVASYRRHTASPGHQRKMSQLQRPEGIIERQKIALDLRKLPFQNAISLDKLSTGNVSRMYFCSACGEGFTCASEEHKKNERHLTLNASRLHCDLCNLYYQNKKCLIKHQNGKLHITMKEIRKEAIQAKCKEAHKEIIPKVHETRQYKATMASKIPAVKTTDRAVLDNKGSKDDRGSLVVTLQAKSVPIASDPIDVSNKDTTGDEDENIIGLDLVIPVSGFFCRCCSKFYNSKHMAKRNHCRTAAHKEKALLWYKSHGITKTVKKYAASNEDENKNPPHGQSAQGPIIVIDDDDDDDDEDAGGDGEENQSKEEQTQSGNKHEGSECPQEQEKMQTGDVPVSGGDTTSHDQTGNDMTEVQIQTRLYDATSASNLVSTKNDEEEKSVFAPPDQEGEPSTNEAEHDARSSIDVEKLESNGSSQQGLELDEDMQSKGEGFLAEKQECPTKGKETWDGQHPPAEGDDLLSAEEELNAKRAQITASRENIDLEEGEILSEGELSTEQQNPPPCKEMMIVATDKPEVGNQELWTKEMEVGSGGENLPCCGSEMGADQVEEAEKPAAGNKDTDWLDDDLYGDLDEQLHEEENDEENSEAEEEPQRDGDEEMEDDEEAKFFIDEGMWEVRSEEGDSDA